MNKPFVVYGAKGSGSVAVEATLRLLGLPYEVIERQAWKPADAELMASVNPMRQVPALVLPSGELLTESAAILIWLADSHPQARLSPALDGAQRPAFLRWMCFIASQIYSLYWIRDDPRRLAADAAHEAVIKARTLERIGDCWRKMDAQVSPGRYILGEDLTVLDLYVAMVSRWGPRRAGFYLDAPKMADVVRRVDDDPRLAAFWLERHPQK